MTRDEKNASLISLQGRTSYRPDVAALARNQIAAAREASNLSFGEFADLLSSILSWPVTAEAVEAWERSTVPPGDVLVAVGLIGHSSAKMSTESQSNDPLGNLISAQFSDVTAVYSSRSEFLAKVPISEVFGEANEVKAAGLSLNLICQHYSDGAIKEMIEEGRTFKCLFLKPYGQYIKEREREEGFPSGQLSALTALNIMTLKERVLPRLSSEAQQRLEIAVYDEPIRFNIILADQGLCIAQPYLPETRGVDSPTFMIRKRWANGGLHQTFEQVFNSLWERREVNV
ncbi:DUF5919 domain-containing protein [Actinacidiphila oryziradicis]|jgi:DNA-binding transcriptional regulator YiaG|uniref:DUF5919 domain-containing protein n=1 Tax=Actinacidiphila oryziradicis TaxID=2571141 RepID=UPI0023F3B811|nr:DUF5919 domain-containing protein [Actinacidiphila oryziradicis]MCW2871289.1 hypothetical protein [Actinacidiphila oryziradicis]